MGYMEGIWRYIRAGFVPTSAAGLVTPGVGSDVPLGAPTRTHCVGAAFRTPHVRSVEPIPWPKMSSSTTFRPEPMTVDGKPDQLGILASSLCAVHCVAGAVVAGASGLGPLLRDERLELGFVGVALLLAAFALVTTFRRHRQWAPLLVVLMALIPVFLARCVTWPSGHTELMLSVTGAMGLVLAHVLNLRAVRASGTHLHLTAPRDDSRR
jgi:hypothetical protein